ncbi:hypothetical protein Efla_006135 [Eimeria flavescens]
MLCVRGGACSEAPPHVLGGGDSPAKSSTPPPLRLGLERLQGVRRKCLVCRLVLYASVGPLPPGPEFSGCIRNAPLGLQIARMGVHERPAEGWLVASRLLGGESLVGWECPADIWCVGSDLMARLDCVASASQSTREGMTVYEDDDVCGIAFVGDLLQAVMSIASAPALLQC